MNLLLCSVSTVHDIPWKKNFVGGATRLATIVHYLYAIQPRPSTCWSTSHSSIESGSSSRNEEEYNLEFTSEERKKQILRAFNEGLEEADPQGRIGTIIDKEILDTVLPSVWAQGEMTAVTGLLGGANGIDRARVALVIGLGLLVVSNWDCSFGDWVRLVCWIREAGRLV